MSQAKNEPPIPMSEPETPIASNGGAGNERRRKFLRELLEEIDRERKRLDADYPERDK